MFHIPHDCPGQAVERDSRSLSAAWRYPSVLAGRLAARFGLAKALPETRKERPEPRRLVPPARTF